MAGGINVKFGATDAGFTSTVKKINESLNGMDRNARNVSSNVQSSFSSMAKIGSAMAGATAAIGAFTAATAASQKVLSEYAEFDSLVRGLKTMDGTAEATAARIEKLREIAKAPGLGFEEVVKADVRLRSTGLSAEMSAKAIKGFGNALASVGGSREALDGVFLALGQISAKGKVSAEEINQLAERVPQIRQLMKYAFGTADTEALQKMGIDSKAFIEGIINELDKLPAVTNGARNVLDNYSDSWKALKTQAAEFGVQIAGRWIDDVRMGFDNARRLLVKLKNEMGLKTPGLQGKDGKTEEERMAEQEAERRAEAEREAYNEQTRAHNDNLAFWEKKELERTEFLKKEAERRVEIEKSAMERTAAAEEDYYAAMMTPEGNIKRKINALESSGPSTVEAINKEKDPLIKADIAERVAKISALKKELNALEERSAETQEREAKAAREKQAVIDENRKDIKAELDALSLRRSGQSDMANALLKENELRKEAAALAEAINVSEAEALKIIKDKNKAAEDVRLVTGGLSERTKERAEKRAQERQQRIEDARLRNATRKSSRERQEELKPGAQGKTREEAKKEKEQGGEAGKGKEDPMMTIKNAVETIRDLVKKIEPKLPTAALAN